MSSASSWSPSKISIEFDDSTTLAEISSRQKDAREGSADVSTTNAPVVTMRYVKKQPTSPVKNEKRCKSAGSPAQLLGRRSPVQCTARKRSRDGNRGAIGDALDDDGVSTMKDLVSGPTCQECGLELLKPSAQHEQHSSSPAPSQSVASYKPTLAGYLHLSSHSSTGSFGRSSRLSITFDPVPGLVGNAGHIQAATIRESTGRRPVRGRSFPLFSTAQLVDLNHYQEEQLLLTRLAFEQQMIDGGATTSAEVLKEEKDVDNMRGQQAVPRIIFDRDSSGQRERVQQSTSTGKSSARRVSRGANTLTRWRGGEREVPLSTLGNLPARLSSGIYSHMHSVEVETEAGAWRTALKQHCRSQGQLFRRHATSVDSDWDTDRQPRQQTATLAGMPGCSLIQHRMPAIVGEFAVDSWLWRLHDIPGHNTQSKSAVSQEESKRVFFGACWDYITSNDNSNNHTGGSFIKAGSCERSSQDDSGCGLASGASSQATGSNAGSSDVDDDEETFTPVEDRSRSRSGARVDAPDRVEGSIGYRNASGVRRQAAVNNRGAEIARLLELPARSRRRNPSAASVTNGGPQPGGLPASKSYNQRIAARDDSQVIHIDLPAFQAYNGW